MGRLYGRVDRCPLAFAWQDNERDIWSVLGHDVDTSCKARPYVEVPTGETEDIGVTAWARQVDVVRVKTSQPDRDGFWVTEGRVFREPRRQVFRRVHRLVADRIDDLGRPADGEFGVVTAHVDLVVLIGEELAPSV